MPRLWSLRSWGPSPLIAVIVNAQSKKRAPLACEARYVTLLQALAGAQRGSQSAATPSNGAASIQHAASMSSAERPQVSAAAAQANASHPVSQEMAATSVPDQSLQPMDPSGAEVPARPRQLWESLGVLAKRPVEQQLASSLREMDVRTLAAAVDAAVTAETEAERAVPRQTQPSAANIVTGMQVGFWHARSNCSVNAGASERAQGCVELRRWVMCCQQTMAVQTSAGCTVGGGNRCRP